MGVRGGWGLDGLDVDADAVLTICADFYWPGDMDSNPYRQLIFQPKSWTSVFGTAGQNCVCTNRRIVGLVFQCNIEGFQDFFTFGFHENSSLMSGSVSSRLTHGEPRLNQAANYSQVSIEERC